MFCLIHMVIMSKIAARFDEDAVSYIFHQRAVYVCSATMNLSILYPFLSK